MSETAAPRREETSAGSRPWRSTWPGRASWVALALYLGWWLARLAQNLAPRLRFEDAMIVLRYARNWVTGQGLVFNPGEYVLGFTTPLFTGISSVFYTLFAENAATAQNLFGAICLAAEAIIAVSLLQRLGYRWSGALAVALITVNLNLSYLYVGMEVHLFAALFLAVVRLEVDGRSRASAVVLALAFLVRYDAAVLALLVGLNWWWTQRRPPWRETAIFFAVVSPWLLAATLYYGSFLPTTLGAKEGFVSSWSYLRDVGSYYAETANRLAGLFLGRGQQHPMGVALLTLLLGVGGISLIRRHRVASIIILFPLLQLLVYARIGADVGFRWHYYSLNPAAAILLVAGVWSGIRIGALGMKRLRARVADRPASSARPSTTDSQRSTDRLGAAIGVLCTLVAVPVFAQVERSTRQPYRPGPFLAELSAVATWIDKRYDDELSILNPAIGLLGYITNNRIIDHAGLVTPGLYYHDGDHHSPLREAVEAHRPDLVLLSIGDDEPEIVTWGYRPVTQFDVSQNYLLYRRREARRPRRETLGPNAVEAPKTIDDHGNAVEQPEP